MNPDEDIVRSFGTSKSHRYWNLSDRRADDLRHLYPNELIQKILGLEALALFHHEPGDTSESLREELAEYGADALNALHYHETKLKVAQAVDRDFTPENDRVRRQLVDTITELVFEVSDYS